MRPKSVLENTSSFEDLRKIVENAKPDVSFLGWRHVCFQVDGKEHKMTLDDLFDCRVKIINSNRNYSLKDRSQLKKIEDLTVLVKETHSLLEKKNIITRILVAIREFFSELFKPRDLNEGFGLRGEYSEYYTSQQFKEIFNCEPEQWHRHMQGLYHWEGRWKIDNSIPPGRGIFENSNPHWFGNSERETPGKETPGCPANIAPAKGTMEYWNHFKPTKLV